MVAVMYIMYDDYHHTQMVVHVSNQCVQCFDINDGIHPFHPGFVICFVFYTPANKARQNIFECSLSFLESIQARIAQLVAY